MLLGLNMCSKMEKKQKHTGPTGFISYILEHNGKCKWFLYFQSNLAQKMYEITSFLKTDWKSHTAPDCFVWGTAISCHTSWDMTVQPYASHAFCLKRIGNIEVVLFWLWQVMFSCGWLFAQLSHCCILLTATVLLQAVSHPCCQHTQHY